MPKAFLLIANDEESLALQNIYKALASLGKVEILPYEKAVQQIMITSYDMVIVDATLLDSEMTLISKIKTQQPHTFVLVLSASPTWRRARDLLKSGADYISKSLCEKDYLIAFTEILNRPPHHPS